MSEAAVEIGGPEYYLDIDTVNKVINVMKYVFDIFHPNGSEQKMLTIGYDGKHGYTYAECKCLCEKILSMLESTNWRRENNVY